MTIIRSNKYDLEGKCYNWFTIYIIVLFIYFVSHGHMLLVYGAWWDDCLSWNVSFEAIEEQASPSNINNPFLYYIFKLLYQIDDINLRNFVYRCVSFSCWLISLSCFFIVLKTISKDKQFTFYASSLAASCALNKCMIMICCYHYTISISLFMIGLVLFVFDCYKGNKMLKLVYSVFWLLSLLMWRTAVLVIPALIAMASYTSVNDFKWKDIKCYISWIRTIINNYYIVIASLLLFVILYISFFKPGGVYSNYYSINPLNVLLSPITTTSCSLYTILSYISITFGAVNLLGFKFLLIVFFFFIAIFFFQRGSNIIEYNGASWNMLIVALLCLFFSIMPQMLIKDLRFTININGYDSRLVSLAMYPIIVVFTILICQIGLRIRVFIIFLTILLSYSNSRKVYYDYAKGWFRNECISSFLKENSFLDGKNISILNNATEYSVTGEDDAYYEYDECARYAYGFDTKTMFISYYFPSDDRKILIPDYYMLIIKNKQIPTSKTLFYDRYLNPKLYEKEVKSSLLFEVIQADKWNIKR